MPSLGANTLQVSQPASQRGAEHPSCYDTPAPRAHVVPLVLNLCECRDRHVRLLLLNNMAGLAASIQTDDLQDMVLPEVGGCGTACISPLTVCLLYNECTVCIVL